MTTATKLTAAETLGMLDRLADAVNTIAEAAEALQFGDGKLIDSFADDSPIHGAGHVVEAAAWEVMHWLGEGPTHRNAFRTAGRTLRQVVAMSREETDDAS